MKTLLAILLLGIGTQLAKAQSVNGLIRDDKANPIPNTTVYLLQLPEATPLHTFLTDTIGHYEITAPEGEYLIEASATGFVDKVEKVVLIKDSFVLLNFTLSPPKTSLVGVTITSKKPFIEAKPGMMVVNVEASATAAGSNALELLQRSPGVQVDPNGAVSMRGKSGVAVYVDGRPSRLAGDQLTVYLKSLTAEEIAQIELITQPGAKYEAAGTAGIINIRTRAVRKQGLNANLGGNASRATETFGNLSARITYRRNKLTLYASEYFNYVDSRNYQEVDRRYLKPGSNELSGDVLTQQSIHYLSRFHRVKIGGEYALSDNTTIGLRAQMPLGHPSIDYNNFSIITDIPSASTTYNSGRRGMDNHWYEKEIGLLARHRFRDDAELSFDGFIVNNHSADHGLFVNEQTDAGGHPISSADVWDMSFPVDIRLLSLQGDYSRTVSKKTKLESGLKYRNVSIDNVASYLIPDAAGVFVNDTLRSTRFLYREGIIAAYASLSHTFSTKLEAQAGLRAEETIGQGQVTKTGENFKRNYLSLFPTLFASYKTDSFNTLTFSYGRRLDRPDYYMLNPARDYVDKYSYSVGNPALLPQFINNFELGYSYKGELTATLSFMQADGIISDYLVQDDATKTAYEMHGNIAGYRQGGFSVNYNKAFRPWWTANLYGDAFLRTFTGTYYGIDYRQRGSSYSFNLSNQFSFKHKWSAELSGWINGPALNSVFTRSSPMGSLDVAVSKKLLADSLVLKLAISDVLGTQPYRSNSRFANFDTDFYASWDARRATLSLNYSFGKNIDLMQRKTDAEKRSM